MACAIYVCSEVIGEAITVMKISENQLEKPMDNLSKVGRRL